MSNKAYNYNGITNEPPLAPGSQVFIRTVNHSYTGRVVDCSDRWVVLDHAAWIANCGRYHLAVKGELDDAAEVEPLPPDQQLQINAQLISDVCKWPGELPGEVR